MDKMIEFFLGLLPKLAEYGILGILLVLALAALYTKDRQLSRLQEKRISEMLALNERFIRLVTEIRATLELLEER